MTLTGAAPWSAAEMYPRSVVSPLLRPALAPLVLLFVCQSLPEPVGDAAPSASPRPELVLTGPLGLRVVGSLGLGGRQIVFLDDERWLSSAGYQVTSWVGSVPAITYHLDSYNYLAVSPDGLHVFGDREVVDVASAVKTRALAAAPEILARSPVLEIEHLRATPDGALGLLELRFRPHPSFSSSPPDDMAHWYLTDGSTGATLLKLPAGNSPFSDFSASFIAVGGTPKQGDVTVVSRAKPTIVATLSMGTTYVNQVDVSPDERWLLAADNTGQVALWDASAWTAAPTTWAAHEKPTSGIAFHPHAPLLATTGLDDTLKLWRIDVGASGGQPQLVTSMALASRPLAVAFTPNGRRIHVGIDWHDAFTESIVIVELTSDSESR